MARISADRWRCVVCNKHDSFGLICYDCSNAEREKQRAERGSVTVKQVSYIEYLMTKTDSKTSSSILFDVIPDYDYDLENISMNQGGNIIAKLLEITEEKNG